MKKFPEILITIYNYNYNENAVKLLNMFSNDFETVVLDSGSDIKNDNFICFENIYYNGLFNESVKLLIDEKKEYKYLLLLTSDISIDEINYNKLIESISDFISSEGNGIYSPSSTIESKSHGWCKNKTSNSMKEVMFVEGYFSLVKKDILEKIYPIDLNINKLGWLTDILIGFYCNELKLKCLIDDKVIIYHPNSTGYNTNEANLQMVNHLKEINNIQLNEFFYKGLRQE